MPITRRARSTSSSVSRARRSCSCSETPAVVGETAKSRGATTPRSRRAASTTTRNSASASSSRISASVAESPRRTVGAGTSSSWPTGVLPGRPSTIRCRRSSESLTMPYRPSPSSITAHGRCRSVSCRSVSRRATSYAVSVGATTSGSLAIRSSTRLYVGRGAPRRMAADMCSARKRAPSAEVNAGDTTEAGMAATSVRPVARTRGPTERSVSIEEKPNTSPGPSRSSGTWSRRSRSFQTSTWPSTTTNISLFGSTKASTISSPASNRSSRAAAAMVATAAGSSEANGSCCARNSSSEREREATAAPVSSPGLGQLPGVGGLGIL